MTPAKLPHHKKDLKSFAKRLNQALDEMAIAPRNRGRQSEAAKLFQKSQKAVRRWLLAEGYPNKAEWESVAERVNVRLEWLFFGLGPMRDGLDLTETDGYSREILEIVITAVNDTLDQAKVTLSQQVRTKLALSIYDRIASRH
jgi:menaquinone-dependent protoporphyrinogen IX oxidase